MGFLEEDRDQVSDMQTLMGLPIEAIRAERILAIIGLYSMIPFGIGQNKIRRLHFSVPQRPKTD